MFQISNLHYHYSTYLNNKEHKIHALKGLSLNISKGEFVVILGSNGSGKSTLAKHLNALILPQEGSVMVDGMDTRDETLKKAVQVTVGLIFQNPDDQIIGSTVEEDVAFGPGNRGVPSDEMMEIVDHSLEWLDLEKVRDQSPQNLSGGQKQKLAIAGVLAQKPQCIVFDEATAMLDTQGRLEVLEAAKKLKENHDVTIIWITHLVDEALEADRVILMNQGEIKGIGTPEEMFSQPDLLEAVNLDLPLIIDLAVKLKKAGIKVQSPVKKVSELAQELCKQYEEVLEKHG